MDIPNLFSRFDFNFPLNNVLLNGALLIFLFKVFAKMSRIFMVGNRSFRPCQLFGVIIPNKAGDTELCIDIFSNLFTVHSINNIFGLINV
jgi:hypothetical protein